MAAQDAAFDKIMEMVGNDGPFQQRFNYIFNAAMVIFGGMSFMNIILALNVPDHWCHVPGREHTNYTLEQWKHLTLPRYFILASNLLIPTLCLGCNFDVEKFQ